MLRLINVSVLLLIATASFADPQGRVRTIDGDTFRIGDKVVRLHGIDAPERDQTCETPDGAAWACGEWASAKARAMFDGTTARCKSVTTDRYDRIVARCTVGDEDMGQRLVSDGLAFAYRKYSADYVLDEKGAAVNGRGLHGHKVTNPAQYRRQSRTASAPSPGACVIKGNISAKGRIFHVPGQRDYAATRINTSKGERWFCSVEDARAAGWRAALR